MADEKEEEVAISQVFLHPIELALLKIQSEKKNDNSVKINESG